VLLLLVLSAVEARAGSLVYLGVSVVDPVSLSVIATVPLQVQSVHPSGVTAYGIVGSEGPDSAPGPGQDTGLVGFLDTHSNTVVGTVALPFHPATLALDPNGTRLYVAGTASSRTSLLDAKLSVIDTATHAEVARIDLGTVPSADRLQLLVHPTGGAVYVLRGGEITVVDATTPAITATIALPVLVLPRAIMHPSGNFIYGSTGTLGSSRALVIDTRLNAVVNVLAITDGSYLGAIVPRGSDNALLFVFGFRGPTGLSRQTVVFDAATGQPVATILLEGRPNDAVTAIRPEGATVYVALFTCIPSCNLSVPVGVAVIDGNTLNVTTTILPHSEIEAVTTGVASSVSFDLTHGLVYFRSNTYVSVIDATTNTLTRTVPFLAEPEAFQFVFGSRSLEVPGAGIFYLLGSTGGATAEQWGAAGDRPVPADYDGDGRADVAVWRPREGTGEGLWYIRRSSDGVDVVQQWGAAAMGDQPVPADYDGDGRVDIAVWRRVEGWGIVESSLGFPSGSFPEGIWYIVRSSDGSAYQQQWGAASDLPVPADYDGDGRADIAVWRAGTWYIVNSGDGAVRTEILGEATDVPVPGDYDGDGRADLAVWRPSTGQWWIVGSRDGVMTRQWGAPGDHPVPADYDGDRRTDLAVWRPSTGEWWILSSRYGAVIRHPWGASRDAPAPADYDGDGVFDPAVYRP